MAVFTFAPLTPVELFDRAVQSFADRVAVLDGDVSLTYAQLGERRDRMVSALAASGIGPGDRVAALCTNNYVNLELNQGVPARGAVLVPLNIRLAKEEMLYILEHSGASMIVASSEFLELGTQLAQERGIPVVLEQDGPEGYEAWLAGAEADPADRPEIDEMSMISLNYTSGTTGRPKGVMAHHRGAYQQALAMAYHHGLGPGSTYLWTLPMFHCNGWCFTWAVLAAGATNRCLRKIDPRTIWEELRSDVTHLCGAPTVLTMMAESSDGTPLEEPAKVMVGGAPPSPTLLARCLQLGLDVNHVYGLTETYGPIAVSTWQPEWDELDPEEQHRLRARQGLGNIASRSLRVLDAVGADVPADGQTIGQIAASGNIVMLGYYEDQAATDAVTLSGCFLSGDLGVMHPDGYVELRDRAKDIIISGGENVASVEVEKVLDSHPDVVESAVVGMPDEKWGEIVCAFVTLRSGVAPDEAAIVAHARSHLGGYKVPRRVFFTDLPKTSTGKIQKTVLRDQVREQA